jgi:glycosyltransferase involved in cell wall biosynthesis
VKKHLFSESDFCDKLITPFNIDMNKWRNKYDFVYFTLNSNQGVRSKGLHMINMIDSVARKMGLKGLMVGYQGSTSRKLDGTVYDVAYKKVLKDINDLNNIDILYKKFDTNEVCAIMRSCKFVLLPNTADASPRLLTEPIIRGVPIVVNENIYGGWKYVSDGNGSLFRGISVEDYLRDKDTIEEEECLFNAINSVLMKDRKSISESFYRDYGFINASKKLAQIVNDISSTNYKAVCFEEWRAILKKVSKLNGWMR